ncbi:MAG: FHA domain-containing protein [Saprospiraceae bacterium]|nr:FHA domain-containing protein [Saprospiraceae bacterium]
MKPIKTIKIGRHESNDYKLDPANEKTSRDHAILYIYKDGTMLLEDKSTNGTFINGNKILSEKRPVKRDDLIKFADQERLDWNRIKLPKNNDIYKFVVGILLIGIFGLLSYFVLYPKFKSIDPCESETCDAICIQKKYDKSVGLICNAYFLKVNFGDKKLFVGFDKDLYQKDQTLKEAINVDQNKLLPFFITGSGFLFKNNSVTDQANLATNRHVADPSWVINKREYNSEEEKLFYEDIRSLMDDAEKFYSLPKNQNRQFITHSYITKFIPSGSLFPLNKNMTYLELLSKLGVSNCQTLRWSKEGNVDIAVLRTDIPTNDLYLIDIVKDVNTKMECINVGDNTSILGYSGGISSGYSFDKGDIDYQMSIGTISKSPSNFEITYDIPTTSGSSGSPIFDNNGKLIAIHFAHQDLKGLGIPIKYLMDVINLVNVVNSSNSKQLEYGN